ncbi:MAG: GMC family oxidoreductase [Cyanobacteria bacterium P01_D01_bin.56]
MFLLDTMARYDIIIIGTGAGGATLAYALAPTGKRILLLEKGDYIPREKANWDIKALYSEGRYQVSEQWQDGDNNSFQPGLYHRVGGSTKVYGAALLRMRERDFETVNHLEGISPAWPLKYEDFEPYYTEAESLYKVHGNRGEDPWEPIASSEFPFPALPHEPRIQTVAEKLQQQGLQPFSLPMGINRNSAKPRQSPCIRCDTCDGFPCLLDAKADAQTCCVDKAIQYDNVALLTNATVDRLIPNAAGNEISAVSVVVNGVAEHYSADVVVVACGAINSAALLLKSACDGHPNGLANSSGMVGRHFMKHVVSKLFAIAPAANETVFQKTLAVNDFYFESEAAPFPLGHVHLMGKHRGQTAQSDLPWLPMPLLEAITHRSVDWWMQTEDLPDPNNRVILTADGRIRVNYSPNNVKAHQRFKQVFKQRLHQAGFPLVLDTSIPLKILNHQVGTCRFGTDLKTSVLDLNCRTHDVGNLYVVDSSFFPSSSAVNPTLTIVANALRVARHLKGGG